MNCPYSGSIDPCHPRLRLMAIRLLAVDYYIDTTIHDRIITPIPERYRYSGFTSRTNCRQTIAQYAADVYQGIGRLFHAGG